LLIAFLGAMVCAADASVRSGNPCCDPCSMAATGEASCDCCQIASSEEPFLTAAKQTVSPDLIAATLPVVQVNDQVPTLRLEPTGCEPWKRVRDHSPPELYVLNASLLI